MGKNNRKESKESESDQGEAFKRSNILKAKEFFSNAIQSRELLTASSGWSIVAHSLLLTKILVHSHDRDHSKALLGMCIRAVLYMLFGSGGKPEGIKDVLYVMSSLLQFEEPMSARRVESLATRIHDPLSGLLSKT